MFAFRVMLLDSPLDRLTRDMHVLEESISLFIGVCHRREATRGLVFASPSAEAETQG